ncbi:flagellar basal body protein [Desulfovibrio sp. OttesenSCG-928-C06]|nr:flagellar basal body protein [Desulfovibrio sp. OttesenSCG-928-C06]
MQSLLNTSLSALGAFGVGMQVTANNIANVNTHEFKAERAHYETGPMGEGVRLSEISRDTSPGPITDTVSLSTLSMPMREGSNVSLEQEFVQMISTENGYTANAHVISTYEDMAGTVINMKV